MMVFTGILILRFIGCIIILFTFVLFPAESKKSATRCNAYNIKNLRSPITAACRAF